MPKSRFQSVEIQFGGETRHLLFSHHALGELEERAALLGPASRIKSMILAIWAALLTETLDQNGRPTARTLSEYQVSRILDTMSEDEKSAIADKISEARGLADPPTENRPTIPPAQV